MQRPYDRDPRQHGITAALGNQHQGLDRRAPCWRVVLALRQARDERAGIAQGEELAATGERDRIFEGAGLAVQ
jgi:hypothetical protein